SPHQRPSLLYGPLTWQQLTMVASGPVLFDPTAAATAVFPTAVQPDTLMQPAITLVDDQGTRWTARRDLLGSSPYAADFVIEVAEDGSTLLRFGDGVYGKLPSGTFQAPYRVGNGAAGNIGAESLYHIVTGTNIINASYIVCARNPLAASGGIEREPIDQV